MRKRILFVAPAINQVTAGKRKSLFPPLSLAILAGLTPPGWDMGVMDEAVDAPAMNDPASVVAITSITAVAPRAYHLADEFRRRGKTVVLGGMHPSALPEEAAQHADAVVVGEAEPVWETVLSDIEKGTLKKIYRSSELPSLANLPAPRLDLFNSRGYLTRNLIQTSRGCPHACDFCAVTRFFGRTYRVRPIDEVMKDLERCHRGIVLFVDDNIVGNIPHAKRLFKALAGQGIKWVGQSSLNIAKDPELLRLASRSGCTGLFIGFESLVSENLKSIGKSMVNKVEEFKEQIKMIHGHGIGIEGAFIFGFDKDDLGVIRKTVQFAKKTRLEAAQFGILTPFPGTPFFNKMEQEGRIKHRDWSKYTISQVVFEPRGFSAEALSEGFAWAYREFYSYRSIFARLLPSLGRNLPFFFPVNLSFRRIASRLS